jgi:hypothetical protein
MKSGGYFSTQVAPGLQVLVLNSNVGYVYNFYSFLPNQSIVDEMFGYAERVLSDARAKGERVIIANHISASSPPTPIMNLVDLFVPVSTCFICCLLNSRAHAAGPARHPQQLRRALHQP